MGLLDDQKRHSVSTVEEERAVLVGLITPQQNESKAKEYLDELDFLAETAGAVTVKKFTQKCDAPNRTTFVGKGKRPADGGRQLLDGLDKVARLGDRLDDIDDIDLLEAVASELVEIYVCGDGDHGNAVDICGGDARYYVGSPGTGCRDNNARFAG